ncbi:hypothetical protein BH10BDE1_BH10BDE1_11380 [soil metagenome]
MNIIVSVLAALMTISFGTQAFAGNTKALPTFVKLEALSYQEICGLDDKGQTSCLTGGGESTWIPESVGRLTTAFSNDSISCGFDEIGLKCWQLPGASPKIDSLPQPQAFKNFFSEVQTRSIRFGSYSACGVSQTTRELNCLVPDWNYPSTHAFRVAPKSEILAIAVDEALICWADGTLQMSEITCRKNARVSSWPSGMTFANLTELAAGATWVCARSKSEGTCWNTRTAAAVGLPTELITAKQWSAASDGLCALTQDQRVVCADPMNGSILPAGLGHSIPPEYQNPNPALAQLWASDSMGCVRTSDGNASCWSWWSPTAKPVKFSQPVTTLFGSSYQPCGLLENGQAECRSSYYGNQTLSNSDRVRIEFGMYNKCFWNSSGVDCRGMSDIPSFRSVTSLSQSRDEESMCVVGIPSDDSVGFDSVQCFSYDSAMRFPPYELKNPTQATTNGSLACALSDDGLTCWGTPYAEVPMPTNISVGVKLAMSSRHACVLDQFGFICWGELSALELDIPRGLEQPGRIVDFALGTSRTCAILDTGDIQCWGRDYDLSGAPPVTTTATSILGRAGLFCALDTTGVHCWGGQTKLPK